LSLQQAIQAGVIVAFIQYIQRMYQPIRDLAEKYNIMQAAMASSERIFALLDTPATIKNPSRPEAPKQFLGEVEFKDVWLAYNPGEPILKGISFRVRPGEKIALVGATGGGKTSIISALCRFYDVTRGDPGRRHRHSLGQATARHRWLGVAGRFLFSVTWPRTSPGGPAHQEGMIEAARRVHIAFLYEKLPGVIRKRSKNGSTFSSSASCVFCPRAGV
jgi:hypothetical protein